MFFCKETNHLWCLEGIADRCLNSLEGGGGRERGRGREEKGGTKEEEGGGGRREGTRNEGEEGMDGQRQGGRESICNHFCLQSIL